MSEKKPPAPFKRSFDREAKLICWNNATIMEGRNPDIWRLDAVGNPVCKALNNCHGPLCYQYDHIKPFSRGGESTGNNCQILQSFVNLYKSNKLDLSKEDLLRVSPKIQFSAEQFDTIEKGIYG